jgi:hypothetical protein
MTTPTLKLLAFATALAVGLTMGLPTEAAQAAKGKKRTAAQTTVAAKAQPRRTALARHWGTNLVPAGPLYNGRDYLGDDPDPNIRFQLLREISARYGGFD